MDEALYLVRVVKREAYEKLLRVPARRRVLTSTLGYAPDVEFPGVCTTPVTRNTRSVASRTLYPGDIAMILSRRLLEQRNYHLNIDDDWGCLSAKNTVFPWQVRGMLRRNELIQRIVARGDCFAGTEVVFHDPIPWSFVVTALDRTDPSFRLPYEPLETDAEPDKTLRPFYVHPPRCPEYEPLPFLRALAATVDPWWASTPGLHCDLAAEFLAYYTDAYHPQQERHQLSDAPLRYYTCLLAQ
jgi:hypothetical protein